MERYSARPSIYGRPIREDNWHVVEPPQPPSNYVPNIFAVQPAYEYNQMNYYQPPTYQVLPPPFYPSPRVVVPASHPQNVLFLKNVYQNSPSYTYERLKAYFQEFQGYKTLHLLWEFVDAAAVIFSNDPCTRWAAANVQGKYLNPARPLEAYVLDYNFVMPFHTCGPNCTFETR
ncbi:uncharacterized protein LOC114246769 [Bombyx mandarina]|uniref:Uncharacterized protein LOC114246769 n=1 Tax=Bombyx mandarina TaxID=7092 RepID=A0A6J2JZ95_BOMMA|nr:uncharacterized protein LOC114246769 [Bombyx mandarina]